MKTTTPRLLWRDLLGRYQVRDSATSVHRDRFGCWPFLDLWRTQEALPFAAAELEFLRAVAGPLTKALRRSQALAFATSGAGEQASAGPIVLLLSPTLSVRAQTPQTERYLRMLVPADDANQVPIPAGAYNVGAQLLAREAGVDTNPPLARVHVGHGQWLTMRAGRMDSAQPRPARDIAVSIETTPPGPRLADRARLRAELPRGRATGPRHHRRGYPGHRPADVRVRAHGPGSSQVDLRQDRHPHPAALIAQVLGT